MTVELDADKLIKAMAQALCVECGDTWDASSYLETCGGETPEEMREGYVAKATAAYTAMRDTLVPVGYALHYSRNPEHNEIEYALPGREALTEADKAAGWFSTPLYALPEIKP